MTIRTYLVLGLITPLLAFGFAPRAAAQSTPADAEAADQPAWTEHFGYQIRQLLKAPNPERQEKAMMLVLQLVRHHDLDIDFEPAVPVLFDIFEGAEEEGMRLLALRVLGAIGDEPALRRLAQRIPEEQSERVRAHTLRLLTVHHQHRQ